MIKTPIRLRETPQTEALPFSPIIEALIVAPWVMHQAAAMMEAVIVSAAGIRSAIFTTSVKDATYGRNLLTSYVTFHLFLVTMTKSEYNSFPRMYWIKREIQVRIF